MVTVLALGCFFKGQKLLKAFKDLGCRTILVGTASVLDKPWSADDIDEKYFVPDFDDEQTLLYAISYLAQDRNIDLVVALEEYSIGKAALVSAHLGCPSITEGLARRVRDKYTMRTLAERSGIPVPAYASFVNRQQLGRFLDSVTGPWLVKPRSAGGSVRIRKLQHTDEVWRVYEELGDQRSFHLIEQYLQGDVYHVDSVVCDGEPLVSVCGRYGTPPYNVWHGGGVFTSRTLGSEDPLRAKLEGLNRQVLSTIGVQTSVAHVEFICHQSQPYFLEIGARVPGSHLDLLTTGATGLNLYHESARLELHRLGAHHYTLPRIDEAQAGMIITLSCQQRPDLSFADDCPEVIWRLGEDYHAGLVFRARESRKVETLMDRFFHRIQTDLLAVLPPSEQPA